MYKIIGANQTEYGPVSAEQLRQWIAEGRVNAQTMAQAAGDTGWKPISTIPEFAGAFHSATPPSASVPPPLGSAMPPLGPMPAVGDRARALDEVNGPAIGLIVTGALGICSGGWGIFSQIFQTALGGFNGMNSMNFPGQNDQALRVMQMFSGATGIIIAVLNISLGILLIYAGLKMKQLVMHNLCVAAGVIALIPCISPCCCVGIPIGIWALVVLNKPEVKGYFSH